MYTSLYPRTEHMAGYRNGDSKENKRLTESLFTWKASYNLCSRNLFIVKLVEIIFELSHDACIDQSVQHVIRQTDLRRV